MKKILTTLSILLSSVAFGQTACDSLTVDVKYSPFTDSMLQIHVINSNTSNFFSYPQFTVFDSNNDTVAHEQMNFFGIAQESVHSPEVYPGMPAANMFPGVLQLYYVTVDSYAVCTWNMNFDLCPDTCQPFYPHFENVGGQQVLGTANWEILNVSQQVVASGSFVLDVNNQSAVDTVCLDPGIYTYKVTNVNMTAGGQKWTGIWSNNMYVASPMVAFNDPVETIALDLYENCQTTTKVKETTKNAEALKIWSADGTIYIRNSGTQAIGNVAVYSIDGKLLITSDINSEEHSIDMKGYPAGLYVVKAQSLVRKVVCGN